MRTQKRRKLLLHHDARFPRSLRLLPIVRTIRMRRRIRRGDIAITSPLEIRTMPSRHKMIARTWPNRTRTPSIRADRPTPLPPQHAKREDVGDREEPWAVTPQQHTKDYVVCAIPLSLPLPALASHKNRATYRNKVAPCCCCLSWSEVGSSETTARLMT